MKILLLGKNGQVGWELQRALALLGELSAYDRKSADLERLDDLRALVKKVSPNVIVNAAAYTAVDKAESEPHRARVINSEAVAVLAEEASRSGAYLVHYSTDYVFDGHKSTPYLETDEPGPLSVYGSTKFEGERAIRDLHDRHFIFRTSWVYGLRGNNFAKTMLRLGKEREELKIVCDQSGAPTSAELLADATALVLSRISQHGETAPEFCGTYHLAASGHTTWHDYALYVLKLASEAGVPLKTLPERVAPIRTEDYPLPAVRPKNSRLDASKFEATFNLTLPHWRYHVGRFVEELTSLGAL